MVRAESRRLKMKTNFKNWIVAPVLAVTIATAAIFPIQPAHAIIGLTAAPGLTIAGIACLSSGLGVGTLMAAADAEGGFIIAASAAIVGLVLLDGSAGQDVAFAAVSPAVAQSIGLSSAEAEAYNHELDSINLIRQNVESQMDPAASNQANIQKASALWKSYQNDLSPEAFSAVEKVAQAASNQKK
jgi:hypothetical protein